MGSPATNSYVDSLRTSSEKSVTSSQGHSKMRMQKTVLEVDPAGHARFHGCSSIRDYEILGKLGEGTFGEVHKARSRKDGSVVAMKKILMHNEKDGFPITALREIKLLKMLSHTNILKLSEMAIERSKGEGKKKAIMYMVTPYMDHDLSGLLENPHVHFTEPQIKCYMLQLLEGVRYLHENKILHRDMKAANLLINNQGILQIADFGLARHYDEPSPQPGKGGGEARRDYTTLVVTRWYRPPELLLQLRRYTTAIDMWGVGCVFGEMFKGKPILAGNSDLHQVQMIFDLVGSPTEQNMPGWSTLPGCENVKSFKPRAGTLAQTFREQGSSAISLLRELLKLDWRKRINAIDALQHPYFRNEPLPAKPGQLPQFEDSHELDRRKFRGQKAALPPAPAGGSVGTGPNGEWIRPSSRSSAQWPHNNFRPGGSGTWHGPSSSAGSYSSNNAAYEGRISYFGKGHLTGQANPRPAWARDIEHARNAPSLHNRDPELAPPSGRHIVYSRAGMSGAGGGKGDSYVPNYSGDGDGSRSRHEGSRREERHDRAYYSYDRREQGTRHPRRSRSRSPVQEKSRERTRERERDLFRR